MRISNPKITLAVLAMLWVSTTLAQAATQVGTLTVEKGPIKMRRNQTSTIFTVEGQSVALQAGDVLHSGAEASAILRIGEGEEMIRLYPSSHFVVTEVSPQGMRMGLTLGKVFVGVLARLRANRVFVNTPTAVIGVKGTEFVTGADEERTFLLTLKGEVSFRNELISGIEETLRADQVSFSTRFEPPAAPVTVTPAQRESILKEPSLNTFESTLPGDDKDKDQLNQVRGALDQATEAIQQSGPAHGTLNIILF